MENENDESRVCDELPQHFLHLVIIESHLKYFPGRNSFWSDESLFEHSSNVAQMLFAFYPPQIQPLSTHLANNSDRFTSEREGIP